MKRSILLFLVCYFLIITLVWIWSPDTLDQASKLAEEADLSNPFKALATAIMILGMGVGPWAFYQRLRSG